MLAKKIRSLYYRVVDPNSAGKRSFFSKFPPSQVVENYTRLFSWFQESNKHFSIDWQPLWLKKIISWFQMASVYNSKGVDCRERTGAPKTTIWAIQLFLVKRHEKVFSFVARALANLTIYKMLSKSLESDVLISLTRLVTTIGFSCWRKLAIHRLRSR